MQSGLGLPASTPASRAIAQLRAARLKAGELAAPAALWSALLAGLLVRAFYVLREDFPVNDGGMFYAMARDLQNAHYLLPSTTSYNGGDIPFVYSPLTIYLAALGDALTPASLLDMFRLLPLAGSVLVLWAFYRLAGAILRDRWTVIAATAAFALAPRAFLWLIMGGGLPRSFGLAFALLAAREAWLLTSGRNSRRSTVLLAVFCALTALSHLETACFLAVTLVLIALVNPAQGIRRVGLGALGGAALVAPWALAMLAAHGPGPFQAALHEGGRLFNDGRISRSWVLDFLRGPVHTSEPYFPLIGALGLVGGLYALVRGQWFLPAWWIVIGLLGARAFPTYVTIATCLLAGVTIGQLVVPALRQVRLQTRTAQAGAIVAAGFCVWFVASGALATSKGETGTFMESLGNEDQRAMEWASRFTPEDARFAVLPVDIWPGDYPGEWFPVLAERVSATTPQGYEWVEGAFDRREDLHEALQACASSDRACLTPLLDGRGIDYVFVPESCCAVLRSSLERGEVVYNQGALIVRWRDSLDWTQLPPGPLY